EITEDIAEDVEDRLGVAEVVAGDALQAGVSVAVVAGPLLRVAQDVERLGGLLELAVRLGVAGVAVGVILHGQLAIGLLERLLVRLARDAQDLVVTSLGGAGHSLCSPGCRGPQNPSPQPPPLKGGGEPETSCSPLLLGEGPGGGSSERM